MCINILQNGNVGAIYQLKLPMNPPRAELIPTEGQTKQRDKEGEGKGGEDWENWGGALASIYGEGRGKVPIAQKICRD